MAGPMSPSAWEDRVLIVRRHFERKGYRVHSGLQFGCELVLYADTPDKVHSDFAVHVVPPDGSLDWKLVQSLVRSMPDLHKTLILAQVVKKTASNDRERTADCADTDPDTGPPAAATTQKAIHTTDNEHDEGEDDLWEVQELAIATEHAPFRHKKTVEVGGQRKRQKQR